MFLTQRVKLTLLMPLVIIASASSAQQLTIDSCYHWAEMNYPLIVQRDLISRSADFTVQNIGKGLLPQLVLTGQATYQSDVTTIPVRIPGVDIPQISKDQFRIAAEVNQSLTDFTLINDQKNLQKINSRIQLKNVDVEMYKIKDRVNQIYFGVLVVDAQIKSNDLLIKDIQVGIDKINALVLYGSEFKSNLDKVKAELLSAKQKAVELQSLRKSFLDVLSLFINKSLSENTVFNVPATPMLNETLNRPELAVYTLQQEVNHIQNKMISSRNLPKLSLFFQGGLGRPSPVNLFATDVKSYYLTGLKLNWTLSSLYTSRNERQVLLINHEIVESQRSTFVFNTNVTLAQQRNELQRLQQLLISDNEIITLRAEITTTSKAQLENGVITANDYVKEINAEDQARQNKALHEMLLLQTQYNYNTSTGNN